MKKDKPIIGDAREMFRESYEAAAKNKSRRDSVTSTKEKGGRGRAVLDQTLR